MRLTYAVRLPGLPPDAREVRIWVPLAQTSAEQTILERTIRTTFPYRITAEADYGNDILFLALTPPPDGPIQLLVEYDALLHTGTPGATSSPPVQAQLLRARTAEGLVIIDDEVRTRAARATRGRTGPLSRARGIYDDVIARMAYDKTAPGWGRGDTARACLLGKGNCTDFHSLFISMARAEGIPARFKIGVTVPPEPAGVIPGYHCWAEFYADGLGWVSVDASEAWKHPERRAFYFGSWHTERFLLSVGRQLRLEPPPHAAEPVNIFFYPYVEVDGQAWSGVETETRFSELQSEGEA